MSASKSGLYESHEIRAFSYQCRVARPRATISVGVGGQFDTVIELAFSRRWCGIINVSRRLPLRPLSHSLSFSFFLSFSLSERSRAPALPAQYLYPTPTRGPRIFTPRVSPALPSPPPPPPRPMPFSIFFPSFPSRALYRRSAPSENVPRRAGRALRPR